jgi:hypothetical protein
MTRSLRAALAVLAVYWLVAPPAAVADSCDAWNCQPGCSPASDCSCSDQSGNDTSAFGVPGQTTHIVYVPECTPGGYTRRVQVTATFSGGMNIRELFVDVYDFNNVRIWHNPFDDCAGSPCTVTTDQLAGEPRTVYVQNFQNNSTAPPGSVLSTLIHIACMPGCSGCASCCNRNCDDNNYCTNDGCNNGTGACTHSNNSNPCGADGNPCTKDFCSNGACYRPDNAASCSDGNACTSGDYCSGGSCHAGSTVVCNDGNPCTADSCNPASGCQATPQNGIPCNDGNACTLTDVCQGGGCVGLNARNCDDGNQCTADGCSPSSGCVYSPLTGPCTGGCNGSICTAVSSTYPWAICMPLFVCGNKPVVLDIAFWQYGRMTQDPGGLYYDDAAGGAVTLQQEWRLIQVSPGPTSDSAYVAIQSLADNKYWTAGGTGSAVAATATTVGPSETFLLTRVPFYPLFSLRAANGQGVALSYSDALHLYVNGNGPGLFGTACQ